MRPPLFRRELAGEFAGFSGQTAAGCCFRVVKFFQKKNERMGGGTL
jgi:hypothetical protein